MSNQEKLFVCYLGGRANGCNTELHDTVFVAGKSIENIHDQLISKWFGNPKQVHIDCYAELKWIDGHEIHLTKEKKSGGKTLFFINYGAYRENLFTEIHEIAFYVSGTRQGAIARAKKELCRNTYQPHLDDGVDIDCLINKQGSDIDDVIEISKVDNYYIDMHPTEHENEFNIFCGYKKIQSSVLLNKN